MARKKSSRSVSKKSGGAGKSAYGFYAMSAVAVILLLAFIFELSYSSSLRLIIGTSSVANPQIRFFVGTAPANVIGVIEVPANQTFCPENSTIINESDKAFSYGYYTELNGNEEFTYSFAQNSSRAYTFATVGKPFSLVSYSSVTVNSSVCAGYPNAKHLLVLKIAAPAKYVGPIYISLYR